ncbi:MAG: Na+/H+ antiporter subunit D [Armatimonadota bacterium]|nr:Na+/H+ antiporter subunit D [Armatimonadota bacterium]MDR7457795.1 Na+/H+ antiporter subunit D [Armatimonadota bacterium]MDR7497295.1 Na+/H+ antiporter subunit D [Armatimonadota bacterium]MDR7512772.1 Na+/H+ antiporter subunit D [Armatimonadota bacterium]
MSLPLALPLLVPLVAAAGALLAARSRAAQRILGVAGAAGLLVAGAWLLAVVSRDGILAVQLGAWPAPFGITLVADLFSGVMVVLAGVMGLVATVYSLTTIEAREEAFGYYPLLLLLLLGVCGAFLTGDLFNLYVWFEVMLMASFVLVTHGGRRAQLEGAIKYVTLNLIASAFFLAAVGITYGVAGTLNMADLARRFAAEVPPGLATTVAVLFLIAFGIKAAAFPLFFWLPAAYHTPPVAISALFSGLLTKVGVYALIRMFTLLFTQEVAFTHSLLLAAAALTMVTGVLGAVAQAEVRRLLSFHIVSQIGYLLMGLGLNTAASLAGAIFFMAHVILSKAALFLVSGALHRLCGTYDLPSLGGAYRSHPGLAVLFLIPALSLAGVPPLSGFAAKLALVQAGLGAGRYAVVAAALGVGLLTLFSMIKIWTEAFWKPAPVGGSPRAPAGAAPRLPAALLGPIVALAALVVLLGVFAEAGLALAARAAAQLLDPAGYARAVLGGGP